MTDEEIRQRMEELNKKAARPLSPIADAAERNVLRLTYAESKRAEANAAAAAMDEASAATEELRVQLRNSDQELSRIQREGLVAENNFNAQRAKYDGMIARANAARPRDAARVQADAESAMASDRQLQAAQTEYAQQAASLQVATALRRSINAEVARKENDYKIASRKYTEASKAAIAAEAVSHALQAKGEAASGTGWFVVEGYIVTNYHVVEGFREFEVICRDGTKFSVTIAARNTRNDLVLLKPPPGVKLPAPIPRSTIGPEVGEQVFTIGYPLPTLMGTEVKVTDGVVSSLTGVMNDPTRLQTSAPFTHGNSGGPLMNSNGEAVGVVVSFLTADSAVGYAIKMDLVDNPDSM